MSRILLVATLVFVALASGVLVWEGLAIAARQGRAGAGREARRAGLRTAVGAVVLAVVLWISLRLLTRAP